MKEKFKGIYRIESARKPNWNYSRDDMYYLTICTGGWELYFGDIYDGEMVLSKIGFIGNEFWIEIPKHFRFVQLDKYQIMPNHIHGLIKTEHNLVTDDMRSNNRTVDGRGVETLHATSLRGSNISFDKIKNKKMAKISPKKGSLSTLIRSFKSAVTKDARIINSQFYWQSRFYDIIVRDDQSLTNIRNYIKNNPKNWIKDELNHEDKKNKKQKK